MFIEMVQWSVKGFITQSCPTLCEPMDCSPPGFSVHGILQARILERVAIPIFRGSSWPRGWTQISWVTDRFFTVCATREGQEASKNHLGKIESWVLRSQAEGQIILKTFQAEVSLPLFLLLGIYNIRPGETFHSHPKITKFLLYCAYQGNEDPCLKLFVLLSQLQYWLGCVCSVQCTWYMKPQDNWSKNIGFSPSRLRIYKKVKSDHNISHNDKGNVTAHWEENIAWIHILQY